MCIILFAFDQHPDHPLILLANRDEFYDRPTLAADHWKDLPTIYGGRDLVGGGTWLGVTKSGRFAAVTNYRDPSAPHGTRTRGGLVTEFLASAVPAENYMDLVRASAQEYSGFNLIVGEISKEESRVFYFSNRSSAIQKLTPGIYGLSNHLLDSPWPKVVKGKARLTELLNKNEISESGFFDILADETTAAEELLPSTGIPFEAEKALSATFIKTPGYGTRCSTVMIFDPNFEWNFTERVFV